MTPQRINSLIMSILSFGFACKTESLKDNDQFCELAELATEYEAQIGKLEEQIRQMACADERLTSIINVPLMNRVVELETDNARLVQIDRKYEFSALDSVLEERNRQDEKWGEQNHDPSTYLTILVEEVGEFAQAALQNRFGGPAGAPEHMREEAVQTAAVALAIVECLDRGKWSWR